MSTKHSGIVETAKEGIVAAAKQAEEMVETTVKTIQKAVAKAATAVEAPLKRKPHLDVVTEPDKCTVSAGDTTVVVKTKNK